MEEKKKGKRRWTVTALMASRTLVLDKGWNPINIIPAFKAVVKVYNGRALFLDYKPEITSRVYDFDSWVMEWDEAVRTAQIAADRVVSLAGSSLVIPEIIICSEYRGFGYKLTPNHKPSFSRRNLWLRDKGQCQFCGKKFPSDEMNMDHVIPKSKGGGSTWENIVLSCIPCNQKKDNKTLKEAGMKLLRKPVQPTADSLRVSPIDRIKMQIRSRPPKTWEAFLGKIVSDMYWNTQLVE